MATATMIRYLTSALTTVRIKTTGQPSSYRTRSNTKGWSRNIFLFAATWEADGATETNRFVPQSEAEGGVLDTDLEKGYWVMEAAQETDAPVPRTHWYETDEDVIRSLFFVVDHVAGEASNTW